MSNPPASPEPALPLAGLRVLDLTRVLAGPFCTMILADLGAEVVKVERPETGDDSRHFPPFLPSGLSAYFASINRGKKSIVLDLKQPGDRETFLKLAERADVLVENFRPGTLELWELSEPRLRAINPRLIYASASGFGRVGQRSRRPAYDIIIQAMSGLMSITGTDAEHAVRVGTSISDILAGLFTAIGILAALRRRDGSDARRAGGVSPPSSSADGLETHPTGADLDLAMLDCSVAALENAVSRYAVTGEVPAPIGTRHPSIVPFQSFPTQDQPIVVAAGNDALWLKLCAVLNAPELQANVLFRTNRDRTLHLAALEAELTARFSSQPADHWLAKLEEAGVPCAPLRSVADVVHDPHLAERGMLHEIDDGQGSTFLTAGSPFHIDGHGLPLSHHAPQLGEHTQEVLNRWLRIASS